MSAFWSRWVSPGNHVTEIDSAALPRGFRSSGTSANIKPTGPDVGLVVCDAEDSSSAACFTSSAVVGAPVVASREADLSSLRAVVASSGNANVADGERGLETARAAQAEAAAQLGADRSQVAVAATGIIGKPLPRERLLSGVRDCAAKLDSDSRSFSEAILTSDRGPKRICVEVSLPSGVVTVCAQAKGAGMISPRFATMFCFVETDARIDAATIDLLTSVCVKRSFDRISVDGQLSTSDSVFCLASGASGVRVVAETDDELALGEALDAVCRQLSLEIVADGEGAKRIGRVVVRGDSQVVEAVARAVANSPLVKTALHGADPNFGRVLQAAGAVLEPASSDEIDVAVEGIEVVRSGRVVDLEPSMADELARAAAGDEVEYVIEVPGSGAETEVFFSDLSPEYVNLNAEYSS